MKCTICDYDWQPRVSTPKACPSCKYRFDYAVGKQRRQEVLMIIKKQQQEFWQKQKHVDLRKLEIA